MVVLSKIYTRTGDGGETALGDGSRVAKHALRVNAYGTVDETNATVGLARLHSEAELDAALARIQNDLFDLGADLCRPGMERDAEAEYPPLRIIDSQVDRLEAEIAAYAPDAVFFGGKAERLANTCYVAAPGLDAETMLMALDLDGIAVSAGAACSSGKVGSPRVLDAMGVPPALSKGAIRVSLGWTSEPGDVDRFVASWARAYERAKAKVKTNVNAGAPRPLASVES